MESEPQDRPAQAGPTAIQEWTHECMALKESETVDDKRRDWEHGATMQPIHFIIALTALAYGSVATLGFVSDDHGLITHPITGIGQQTVSQIFTQDLWHFRGRANCYYRPLMMLSLKVDHLSLW